MLEHQHGVQGLNMETLFDQAGSMGLSLGCFARMMDAGDVARVWNGDDDQPWRQQMGDEHLWERGLHEVDVEDDGNSKCIGRWRWRLA